MFARLDRPIDFDALDGQPVDLVFVLLAPEGAGADHLKALARIARLLRDPEIAESCARRVIHRQSTLCCHRHRRYNGKIPLAVIGDSRWRSGRRWQLVHAYGFELMAPGAGDRGFAAVGQHDRSAICGKEREQVKPGAISGACGNSARTSSDRIGFT